TKAYTLSARLAKLAQTKTYALAAKLIAAKTKTFTLASRLFKTTTKAYTLAARV
ncbi:unnamed protein product, partial [marine sediment metagenome]